eukprot:1159846-Pelagomonas_calceolata.AAC.14
MQHNLRSQSQTRAVLGKEVADTKPPSLVSWSVQCLHVALHRAASRHTLTSIHLLSLRLSIQTCCTSVPFVRPLILHVASVVSGLASCPLPPQWPCPSDFRRSSVSSSGLAYRAVHATMPSFFSTSCRSVTRYVVGRDGWVDRMV